MWYWVKSPDGQETDYNLEELRRALAEGRVQPNWAARRHDRNQWTTAKRIAEEEEISDEPDYAFFTCGRCRHRLQIQLPIDQPAYKCPQCLVVYQVTKAAEDPAIYIFMPDLSGAAFGESSETRPGSKPEPPPRR